MIKLGNEGRKEYNVRTVKVVMVTAYDGSYCLTEFDDWPEDITQVDDFEIKSWVIHHGNYSTYLTVKEDARRISKEAMLEKIRHSKNHCRMIELLESGYGEIVIGSINKEYSSSIVKYLENSKNIFVSIVSSNFTCYKGQYPKGDLTMAKTMALIR